MLIHPSSGACDLFDELFHGLYCSGTMCVGVTLWFGWGGVVSGCTPAKPHRNTNTYRTRAKQPNEITQQISRKLLRKDVLTSEALLQPASGYHTTPAKLQRNTNTHRTRAIQPMK